MDKKIPQSKIRFADLPVSKILSNRDVSEMNYNTQNAKIASITEKTLIIGIDVGKESDYAVLTNQYSFHTEIATKSLLKAGVLK